MLSTGRGRGYAAKDLMIECQYNRTDIARRSYGVLHRVSLVIPPISAKGVDGSMRTCQNDRCQIRVDIGQDLGDTRHPAD